MTVSPELTRFLVDHATAESRAAFAGGIAGPRTAAAVAAAMTARGYQVGEADVAAVLEGAGKLALTDQQLVGVVGGVTDNATIDYALALIQSQGSANPGPKMPDTAALTASGNKAATDANSKVSYGAVMGALGIAGAMPPAVSGPSGPPVPSGPDSVKGHG